MEILLKLPLPKELIYKIVTYDRILSIKPISKDDYRYNLLLTIPKKEYHYYGKFNEEIFEGYANCWECIIYFNNPKYNLYTYNIKDGSPSIKICTQINTKTNGGGIISNRYYLT